MKILSLEIRNFRGIREATISYPAKSKIGIMIGAGDSTKTTIINAIQWNLWPTWNLQVIDTDFYNRNIDEKIIITGTYCDLPKELLSEEKFGLYLRNPDIPYDGISDDEPKDGQRPCVSVQLSIDKTLEPKWEIVCNRKDPLTLNTADRKKFPFNVVGDDAKTDLQWGKYSVLQKYADSRGVLHDAYINAMREVANHADLTALDTVVDIVKNTGKEYGVGFNSEITNKLIYQNGSFSTSVGLFDGNIPLNMRGLGSRRLLSMGLNINASEGDSLLMIDEIENGLEPYRIKSLINEFRTKGSEAGQILFTTHSSTAVAEAKLDELLIVNSKDGLTKVSRFPEERNLHDFLQRQVRSNAEAILSKRLLVCEGKTEIGYIRALDNYLDQESNERLAYYGVGTFLGEGENIFKCVDLLKEFGYDLCVFMDSDKLDEEEIKRKYRAEGIRIIDWEQPYAIEDQLFMECPLHIVQTFLDIAVTEKGTQSICSQLKDIAYKVENDQIVLEELDREHRAKLGKIAKNKNWFKRIDLGEQIGDVVFQSFDEFEVTNRIKKVFDEIMDWTKN